MTFRKLIVFPTSESTKHALRGGRLVCSTPLKAEQFGRDILFVGLPSKRMSKGILENMGPRPQAFVALPYEARQSDLQSVIEETLHHNGVDAVSTAVCDNTAASNIAAKIQDLIRRAAFVVADVSSANPNVMLEVGMAMGMGKPLLLLSRARTPELPFDLAAQQVAVYRPDDLLSVRKYLELWLRDAIAERA